MVARELRGGGALSGDGGGAVAARARQRDNANERTRPAARHGGFAASPGLISGPGAGVRTTNGMRGQLPVGHDYPAEMAIRPVLSRLTVYFLPLQTLKPWRVSKIPINKSCRAM